MKTKKNIVKHFYYVILFLVAGLSNFSYSQDVWVSYENISPALFAETSDKIKIAILDFTSDESSADISERLFEKLKTSPIVLSRFEIISFKSLQDLKSSLGFSSLEPTDSKFRNKIISTLEIEYLVYGTFSESGKKINLIIDQIKSSYAVFQGDFLNSKNSSALNDILKLFSEGEKSIYTPVGSLTIKLIPDHASIKINNKKVDSLSNIEVLYGENTLEISKKGFKPLNETIFINSQDTTLEYSLEEMIGKLIVKSTPSNATKELYFNDSLITKWQEEITKEVPVGQYTLKVTLAEYDTVRKQINIFDSIDTEENISLEKLYDTGRLEITVIPDGAKDADIFVNDTLKGKAPINLSLFTGKYKLYARKTGFWDDSTKITLTKNAIIPLKFNLTKQPDENLNRPNKTWNWITTILAGLGAATSGYLYSESISNHDKYLTSAPGANADYFKSQTDKFEKNFWISASATAGLTVIALILWIWN